MIREQVEVVDYWMMIAVAISSYRAFVMAIENMHDDRGYDNHVYDSVEFAGDCD